MTMPHEPGCKCYRCLGEKEGREMFINRDWNRTEADDYKLNVEPRLTGTMWATPQYVDGVLMGWKLNYAYA